MGRLGDARHREPRHDPRPHIHLRRAHGARLPRRVRGFGTVYAGIARRAYEITVDKMPDRTSIALTRSMAHHPEVQHYVAEMRMDLEMIDAFLERTAADWAAGVDYGMDWPVKIIATKHTVVNRAFEVVDRALDL